MKVYKFGAITPLNKDLVMAQMQLAHKYYNALIETRNRLVAEALGEINPPEDEKEAREYWTALRKKVVKEVGWLDKKPIRKKFIENGLYWGSYLGIDDAFSKAEKSDPVSQIGFRSWRQCKQAIGVQIQEPTRAANFWQVEDAPDPRTGRRANQRKILKIRVGSEKRDPVWAFVPFTMHRPIDGRVRWVHVTREVVCGREKWHVAFVCSDEAPRRDGAATAAVAVDVGWRKMEDGSIRIATAADTQGNRQELRLDANWVERNDRADRIRGHRADLLNELLAEHKLHPIRSAAGVARKYYENKDANAHLADFVRRDRHLRQYEIGNRRRAVNRRRDSIRKFARKLRRNYVGLVVKNSSAKKMKEKAKKNKELHKPARKRGQQAAPGETKALLEETFRDGVVISVTAVDTTRQCPKCFRVGEKTAATVIECERCGYEADCDTISTQNMLREAMELRIGDRTARKRPPKFAKKHAKKEAV